MNSPKFDTIKPSQNIDQFSRTISYLRLSLTDRCNLRCTYCMPQDLKDEGLRFESTDLLSYEELLRIVNIAVDMGMNKLRLTGGEPLVRKGVMEFIEKLAGIKGLEEIRLTTNGVLLADMAERLYAAGIRRLNVSLDSLKPERFAEITGRDYFAKVWQGIETALAVGFKIKLNVVAMKGINDDEFVEFAKLTLDRPLQVRFIEFMPMGAGSRWKKDHFISAEELKKMIGVIGRLTPVQGSHMDGPARVFSLTTDDGREGRVGFISPISHHFCDKCNRLRLTSGGRLRACLLHDHETDLKAIIRAGASDQQIREAIKKTILDKPKGHTLQEDLASGAQVNRQGQMSRIGG